MTANTTAVSKNRLRQNILEYIQSEAKKGRYPTHMELEEKFHTKRIESEAEF